MLLLLNVSGRPFGRLDQYYIIGNPLTNPMRGPIKIDRPRRYAPFAWCARVVAMPKGQMGHRLGLLWNVAEGAGCH